AQQLLDRALTLFQDLDNKPGVVHTTFTLGLLAHQRGEFVLASILQRQALSLSREVGDSRGICWCLEGLAALACAQGELNRAARLFGAAHGLHQRIQAPRLAPAGRISYANDLADVRARLDEATFETVWAEGGAMTMEQAVAYALAGEEQDAPASAS